MIQAATPPTTVLRQRLLVFYLAASALDSRVIAWSEYDGTTTQRPGMEDPEPPYATPLAAMRDGWRVIQVSPINDPRRGEEFELGHLRHEVILEKIQEVSQ